jgi:hypothetical protein
MSWTVLIYYKLRESGSDAQNILVNIFVCVVKSVLLNIITVELDVPIPMSTPDKSCVNLSLMDGRIGKSSFFRWHGSLLFSIIRELSNVNLKPLMYELA